MVGCPDDLTSVARRLEGSPAEVSKIAFVAAGPADALAALELLRVCRKPMTALAMGEAGAASRLLARKFGAFGTFASLHAGAESAPGQFALAEMRELFRWDSLSPTTSVYGVIGCPVAHSLSPAIHNAAFAAAGLDAVYVPLLVQAGEANFRRFLDALTARPWLDWRGLSVTIPHKENALAYVGAGAATPWPGRSARSTRSRSPPMGSSAATTPTTPPPWTPCARHGHRPRRPGRQARGRARRRRGGQGNRRGPAPASAPR